MVKWHYLQDEAEIAHWLEVNLADKDYCVIDTETVSPDPENPELAKNPRKAKLVDIQVGAEGTDVLIFPAEHRASLLKIPKKLRLVLQNAKYDFIVAARHGIDLRGYDWHDTMLIDHLVNEMRSHSLDDMVARYFRAQNYKSDFWDTYANYTDAPFEVRCEYGAQDIYWTNKVYRWQLGLHS